MAFTTFVDDLGLIEVLLALVGALFAYSGVLIWWSIRQNDAPSVRKVLKGVSTPLAAVGGATLILAFWGEMTWPFLASDGLAGYNIFFFDPMLLLGLVLVAYAVSAQYTLKLQYAGLLALLAGAATLFYGYSGYTATPAFTKEPFDTLLLYMGFGAAGIFAFPTSVVVDYYLKCADAGEVAFAGLGSKVELPARRRLGIRGAQSIAPNVAPAEAPPKDPEFRFPYWAQVLVLLFPVFAALAAIAAFWYFGTTLPGHLGQGPSKAP